MTLQPPQFFGGAVYDPGRPPNLPFQTEKLFAVEGPSITELQIHDVRCDFQHTQGLAKVVQHVFKESFRIAILR